MSKTQKFRDWTRRKGIKLSTVSFRISSSDCSTESQYKIIVLLDVATELTNQNDINEGIKSRLNSVDDLLSNRRSKQVKSKMYSTNL
jgi:hypothetical protein